MKIILPNRQFVMYLVVVLSVLISASGSFLVVKNGHGDSKRVACQVLYNTLDGKARDERAKFATKQTKADKRQTVSEIEVWTNLKEQFSTPPSGNSQHQITRFLTTIQHQIDSLNTKLNSLSKTQTSRIKYPYPDPNACKDNKITKKEGNIPQ